MRVSCLLDAFGSLNFYYNLSVAFVSPHKLISTFWRVIEST